MHWCKEALLLLPLVYSIKFEISPEDHGTFSEIFKQFRRYQLIVHYDNSTMKNIDKVLNQNVLDFTSILLYNYDLNKETVKNFQRPLGYAFFHVVYLQNPFIFEEFTSRLFNVEFVDVILFIEKGFDKKLIANTNIYLKTAWMQDGVNRCGLVILLDVSKRQFYTVKFYSGEIAGVINNITTSKEQNGIPDLAKHVNNFRDFNGHVFYVAYYPYAPFIWCESHVDGPGCVVKGIEGNILLLLSGYLNFTFVMKYANSESSGSLWKAMIEDVHYGRRDWAVGGISTSSERMKLADFTTMLHMESYTTFFTSPDIETKGWDSIIRPFRIITWINLLIDIVCIGILIKMIVIVHDVTAKYIYIGHPISIPFYIIVEQSILPNLRIKFWNFKLILSIWFLMSIIITTAYKSKLASTMIKPSKKEANSILDLYDDGYSFQVNWEDWTVLEENLEESTDENYRKILERCDNNLNFCDAAKATIDYRKAIIDEETPLQYIVLNSCQNYESNKKSKFRLVREQLFPSVHAWPLQLGAPYRYRFSLTMQRLVDAGIIEYWYKTLISKPMRRSNFHYKESTESSVFTIENCYGPLIILAIGETIGILFFVGEILYFKYFN